MSRIKRFIQPTARTSVVRKARRAFGRVGAPGLNPEFEALRSYASERFDAVERDVSRLDAITRDLERHMPSVLNAIASTNGTARLLRREVDDHVGRLTGDIKRIDEVLGRLSGEMHCVDEVLTRLSVDIGRIDGHIRDELWPLQSRASGLEGLYETTAWLTQRVETVRAEMMHELRYGVARSSGVEREPVAAEIINPDALKGDEPLRLNLGCGHIPLDGYVNVDMRPLPGVDVVATVGDLPFDPGTVGEVFSAHMLEHFPQLELERQLLPYWRSLLMPGGLFRGVVPDIEAMLDQYRAGKITWDNLREVTYGGQEYEGDFHYTAFTPESLAELLTAAGFVDVELVERGRENGDCLEFEIAARNPG